MRRRMSLSIGGRVVFVLLHGKSIEQLESRIEEFKDYDICYAGINQFTITEDNILSKIGKKFDIIQDCSEVAYPEEYESKVRIPRITEFIKRPVNNTILTTEKVYDLWCRKGLGWTRNDETYLNRFIIVDDYVLNSVPNSLALYLLYLARFGAKRIILFGCDGYVGRPGEDLDSYYRKEDVAKEREAGFHDKKASGLHSDSSSFDAQFLELYRWFRDMYATADIEILNCSDRSMFTIFKKIRYDEVKNYL